ncbi:uncharacterized protein PAC_14036 [Phialocephala subalpina]|uniref:Uncharacterized protein n=1 Tax=Phialocephala subalpina TaxID=576137 RepID=A0A1L7XGG4_9HELO|nr:uncharacterized protein PAC_14036 [Phialocephala subalpina]
MTSSFTPPFLLAAKPKGKPSERDTDFGGRTARLSHCSKPPKTDKPKDTDFGN